MRTIAGHVNAIPGMNHHSDLANNENSILYEGNFQLRKQAFHWRYEFVNKSSAELALPPDYGNNFNIHALTLGYDHRLTPAAPVQLLLGAQTTFNFTPSALRGLYGKTPVGFEIYLHLLPHRHGL